MYLYLSYYKWCFYQILLHRTHKYTSVYTWIKFDKKKIKKNKNTCISCRTHSTYVELVKDQLLPFFTYFCQITLSSMLSSTFLYILHCFKCYYNSEQTSPSYLFAHNKNKDISVDGLFTIIIKSLCKVVVFFYLKQEETVPIITILLDVEMRSKSPAIHYNRN